MSDSHVPPSPPPFHIGKAAVIFAVVFAICMSFARYTDHAWEDFYITYRSSKNLALGNGLVFTPGERVHSFTSPLNVLIPAGLSYVTGNRSDTLVLWLFRVISAAMLALAAVLLYDIARWLLLGPAATFVLLGMFATDVKIVDYSINGQETGIMMLCLAMTLHAMIVPGKKAWLRLGMAWTCLMWTRPDGCVYGGILAIAFLIFNPTVESEVDEKRTRRQLLTMFFRAGGLTAVLYLPWFLWAWSYFGSPVPHTVIAKGLGHAMDPLSILKRSADFVIDSLRMGKTVQRAFMPTEWYRGGWPQSLGAFFGVLGWMASWYVLLPFGNRMTRALSLCFLLGNWYLHAISPIPFSWYFPNIALFAILVLSQIVQQSGTLLNVLLAGLNDAKAARQARWIYRGIVFALPAVTAVLLLASAIQFRFQQQVIEESHRKQIGLWLHEHARSANDTVLLEPLGYIGYFSQLKMLDSPGLCSPEMVAARRRHPTERWADLVSDLKPDWMVLRPRESKLIEKDDPELLRRDYTLEKTYDVTDRVREERFLPGRGYFEYDEVFNVYKKRP